MPMFNPMRDVVSMFNPMRDVVSMFNLYEGRSPDA